MEDSTEEYEDFQVGDFIEDKTVCTPLDVATKTAFLLAIQRTLDFLSERESKIIRMRFGIDAPTAYTLNEIGQQFGVTRERIRQIEAKALQKLQNPYRSDHLRSFVGM